jgi:transposase
MGQVHVICGPERRRRWSEGEKRAIVAAAFAPGAVVTDIARRADVCPSLVYRWRQLFRAASHGFAEVVVTSGDTVASPIRSVADTPMLEVEFSDMRVRIAASIPPDLAAAVMKALRR